MTDSSDPVRQPVVEPEILPPGDDGDSYGPKPRRTGFLSMSMDNGGRQTVYVGRVGPLTILLALLGIGLAVAAAVALVVGALLIWLPAIGLIAGGLLIARTLKGARRRTS